MITCTRHDCKFYSTYTDTCDYTLLMYKQRGCPIDGCTEYTPCESERRSWSLHRRRLGDKAEARYSIPEPAIDYISSLPEFDAEMFFELTGIRLEGRDNYAK